MKQIENIIITDKAFEEYEANYSKKQSQLRFDFFLNLGAIWLYYNVYPRLIELSDNPIYQISIPLTGMVMVLIMLFIGYKGIKGKIKHEKILEERSRKGIETDAIANIIVTQGNNLIKAEAEKNALIVQTLEKEISDANQEKDDILKQLDEKEKASLKKDRLIGKLSTDINKLELHIEKIETTRKNEAGVGRQKEEFQNLFKIPKEKVDIIIKFLLNVQGEDAQLKRNYALRLMSYYVALCSLGFINDNLTAFANFFFPYSGKQSLESYRKILGNTRTKANKSKEIDRMKAELQNLVK